MEACAFNIHSSLSVTRYSIILRLTLYSARYLWSCAGEENCCKYKQESEVLHLAKCNRAVTDVELFGHSLYAQAQTCTIVGHRMQ